MLWLASRVGWTLADSVDSSKAHIPCGVSVEILQLPWPSILYRGALVGDVVVEPLPVAELPGAPLPLVFPTSRSSASASWLRASSCA